MGTTKSFKGLQMKKAELLTQIAALNAETKLPKGYDSTLMDRIAKLNQRNPKAEAHPPILVDGAIAEVWCLKHERYESIDGFTTSTKTKHGYHNKCIVADYQWRKYLRDIKALNAEMMECISNGDFATVETLATQIKTLDSAKAGAYPREEDMTAEEVEALAIPVKEV